MSVGRAPSWVAWGALALALLATGAAGRALVKSFDAPAGVAPADGLFGHEGAVRARALLARLVRGLLAVQRPEGGFDPWPDEPSTPAVKRTVAGSLAVAALAEAVRRGTDR